MNNRNPKLRALIEGAIMVAMAVALNYVKLFKLPNGGSVDLSMVPIIIFAVRHGLGWGLGAGLAFGLLDFITGGVAYGWQVIVLDYLLAFPMLGLAGLFKSKAHGVITGSIVGGAGKFLIHFISGVVIWGEWMPDAFFGMTMTSPTIYSLLYNGSFMGINIVLSVILCALLEKPLSKVLPKAS